MAIHADHHQRTQALLLGSQATVDAINPNIDPLLGIQPALRQVAYSSRQICLSRATVLADNPLVSAPRELPGRLHLSGGDAFQIQPRDG